MRYKYKDGEKLTRFSIRKYHFGAASVAVASLIFFGGGMSAKAENIPTSQAGQGSADTANATTGTDKNVGGDSGNPIAIQNNSATLETTATALPTAKVDKSVLNKLTLSLDASIKGAGKEKIASISNELDKVLADAKEVLKNEKATVEEVNKQIDELTKAKKKLEDTVAEADKKAAEQKKAEEAKKVEKSNGTEKSTSVSGKEAESNATIRKEETSIKPAVQSEKKKLEILAGNLEKYYKAASEITRPETKEMLKGVDEIVRSVENGLKNP